MMLFQKVNQDGREWLLLDTYPADLKTGDAARAFRVPAKDNTAQWFILPNDRGRPRLFLEVDNRDVGEGEEIQDCRDIRSLC